MVAFALAGAAILPRPAQAQARRSAPRGLLGAVNSERFVTSKPGGLGMGLAISRSIIEAHGGRIRAAVNVDRGLTFHVELPCENAVQPVGHEAHSPGVMD